MKFRKRRKGQDGGQKTDEQQIDFQKGVMRNRDEKLEENLEKIRQFLGVPLGKWRTAQNTRESTPENVRIREENRRKVHKSDQEKSAQETSEESQSGTPG